MRKAGSRNDHQILREDAHDQNLARSADRYSDPNRPELGSLYDAAGVPLISREGGEPRPLVALGAAADEQALARDMIDVHGPEAASVARVNARGAALAAQTSQAKFWIRVSGIIQRHLNDKAISPRLPGKPLSVPSAPHSTQG